MNKINSLTDTYGKVKEGGYTFVSDFMQVKRTNRLQTSAGQGFRSAKRLWVLACIVFCYSLLAASSLAKPVFAAHHANSAASVVHDAGQWIDQAAESAVYTDWENDGDEWEDSFLPGEKSENAISSDMVFVPVKSLGRSLFVAPSVPLFVLFHAWKDHLS